ncbi:MAG: hypothetical protein IJS28_01120 [Synergistaceae bacterium]|nr:hypothetical protein [Synergistaceae bacterium]
MQINNFSYTVRDELLANYSRTAQALRNNIASRFDNVFDEVLAKRINYSEQDKIIAGTAQVYVRAKDISGHFDPVLAAYSRNGNLT